MAWRRRWAASRPAWKVLRVLGNLLQVPDFDYASAEEVRAVVQALAAGVQPDNTVAVTAIPPATTTAAGIAARATWTCRCTGPTASCAVRPPSSRREIARG